MLKRLKARLWPDLPSPSEEFFAKAERFSDDFSAALQSGMNKSERDKEISRLLEEGRHRTCEPGTNVMDEPVGYEYKNYKKQSDPDKDLTIRMKSGTRATIYREGTFSAIAYIDHDYMMVFNSDELFNFEDIEAIHSAMFEIRENRKGQE